MSGNPWFNRLEKRFSNPILTKILFAIAMAQANAGQVPTGRVRMSDPPNTCTCHRGRCEVHADEKRAAAAAKRERRKARNIRNQGIAYFRSWRPE